MKKLFILLLFYFVSPLAQSAESSTQPYADLLKAVVREDGVRWDAMGQKQKGELTTFLTFVADPKAADQGTKEAQLAFWINAHNACVMKFILERMPVDDVMKIQGFRDKLKCNVAGQERTLIDIESGVMRPLFSEPRIHFALWWGVKGGARLAPEPYDAANLNAMLESQAKSFAQENVQGAKLSPIYNWYRSDFGKDDNAVMSFVKQRLPKEKSALVPNQYSKAQFLAFDWTLDQTTKRD